MKAVYTIILTLIINFSIFATTYTSIADGNWTTYTVWSPAGVPLPDDEVIINSNVIIDNHQYITNGYTRVGTGSITINSGASLSAATGVIGMLIDDGGTIINNGTFSINQMSVTSGTLTNNSTCNFYSYIYNLDIINNYGSILEVDSFYTSGAFNNYSNASVNSDSIYNGGATINNGTISVIEMYNNGIYTNNGTFSFNRYYNNKDFINNGIIASTYDATNAGQWHNTVGATINLEHSFTNGDLIELTPAHLINNGEFNIGYDFLNIDTISGSNTGSFTVQNNSNNAGVMLGNFDFCDLTPPATAPLIDYNTGSIATGITFCTVNIATVNVNNNIDIYPNPATDILHINTELDIKNIKIIDSVGQILINTNKAEINISELNSGVYIVLIKTKNTVLNKQIIIN